MVCAIIASMKAIHFFGVFFALFSGVGAMVAQPLAPAPAGAKPSIQFQKLLHDFGRVKETDVLRHEFIITNAGNATLEVTDVRPGCPSCTTALPWDRKVEPGKTGKIPIEFRARGFSGTVSKLVTVTCNDPVRNTQNIQIQATVWKPVDITPAYVYFMGVEGEVTNETKVVRITNNMEEPITLESLQSNNPNFKTELKTLKPGKEFELQVFYSASVTNAPPQGVISMKTSSTNMPMLTLTAYAMPQPAFVTMPQAIFLPTGPLSPNYRVPVTIRNNSVTPVKLSDAVVNAEGVTIETTETQPGKLFTLNVSFSTNFQARAEKRMELTVKTTHPRYPVLRVPFVAPAGFPASAQRIPPPGARN
jgi:uncharacterized protein DUF1573